VVIDGQGLTDEQAIPDRVPPVSGWRLAPVQRPHGEYAFTWFSLGMTLLLVWLSLSFSRRDPSGPMT
jgi:cytochrome oxidase assembly protein ShyY1